MKSCIATACATGFISAQDIQQKSRLVTTVGTSPIGFNAFYKDIKFSCDGVITHVIAAVAKTQSIYSPEIRIWRSNSDGFYVQSGPSMRLNYNEGTPDESSQYLRWYNLSEPMPVKQGDLFGIYQPSSDVADSVIYFQRYSGPVNYNQQNQPLDYNVYDLVSVIFGESMLYL